MIQQVQVKSYIFNRETGKSDPGPPVTVSIEIDIERLAQSMFTKGRKTLADGLVTLTRIKS